MLTFPLLTERLELTPLTQADRDAFVAYRRIPEVTRWQSWTPDYAEADADNLIAAQPSSIESQSGRWLQIAVRRDGMLVGDVAVHALAEQPDTYEVGVTIAPACQGSGYATEALATMIGGLFDGGMAETLAGSLAAGVAVTLAVTRPSGPANADRLLDRHGAPAHGCQRHDDAHHQRQIQAFLRRTPEERGRLAGSGA